METDFNFDTDFNTDTNFETDLSFETESNYENRYIKPKRSNFVPAKFVVYDNAAKLATDIDIKLKDRIYAIVSGNFIFGDFIEAFISENNFKCKSLTISTLSMSENNVDSLKNLMLWGNVEKINLIISRYFFSHEIRGLIPYIYQELDFDNRFQLAVCHNHSKITQFESVSGQKCVMYGSANLRSSQNFEQITIEQNNELYDFNQSFFDLILQKYATIQKPLMYKDLNGLIESVEKDKLFNEKTQF